jgi:hypothetical protein
MILKVYNDGSKENLYPQKDGMLPEQFRSLNAAQVRAERLRNLGADVEVVPTSVALKYPIPKRW